MTVTISKPAINIREKLAEVDKPSGTAGQALLRAETVAEQQHLLGVGRRNIVINGDFSQWQRGTSFTGVATSNTYLADRWVYSEGGTVAPTFTITKEAGPTEKGFANSIKFNVTTADNSLASNAYVQLIQKIEGYNLQSLAKGTEHAKSITVSFYVKSNKPGRYALVLWDAANNRQNSGSYEIETPDTWEYKTVTFTGDTTGTIDNDNTAGLQLSFTLAMGTAYTGGDEGVSSHSGNSDDYSPFHEVNLIESTGNTWELAGVQMEVGTVATPFEHRSYSEELSLCQRYYQTYEFTTQTFVYIEGSVATYRWIHVPGWSKTNMRATPTVTLPSVPSNSAISGFGTNYVSSMSATGISDDALSIRVTTQTSGGNSYEVRHWDGLSGSKIQFNAEI